MLAKREMKTVLGRSQGRVLGIYAFFSLIIFTITLSPSLTAARQVELTLKDVLHACNKISNFKSSDFVADFAGSVVNIGDQPFEMRLFLFKGYNKSSRPQTFKTFVQDYELEDLKSKIMKAEYADLIYFREPQSVRDRQIYFMLSLRPLKGGKIAS